MTEKSLKDKTVKGVGWSFIDNISGFAVTFVVGLVLARLLSPEDYGLIGIIAIFTAISTCFINAGLGSAVIRKKDATDLDYSTAFIVNMVMSFLLYALLFICSPLIADFFHRNELIALTRVSSLNLIISSFGYIQGTLLTKSIDFKSQTKITLIGSLCRGAVGIVLAFNNYGVWALVSQELVGNVVRVLLLYYYGRWMPKLRFSSDSFKELFGFGSKLFLSSLIDTIWREIYQVVLGRFYSPSALCQYTRATGFSGLFSSNLTSVVQRVSYPVLCEIQNDKGRLKEGYRRIIRSTMLATFFCMLTMVAIAKPLILSLIGIKWLPAASYLQIICLSGMLYPLHAINLNMLQVEGRSDLFLKLEIIKKIIAIGPLMLGIFFDIESMLWGSVLIGFISYFLNGMYSGDLIGYGMLQQIKDVLPSFSIALVTAFIAWLPAMLYDLFGDKDWATACCHILIVQLFISVFVMITLQEICKLPEYIEIKSIIFNKIRKNDSKKTNIIY